MAQWLQLAGATNPGTNNQIQINTAYVRLDTVIAPTQAWLTLNSNTYSGQNGNPVMQFTFNTPVGASAANQCGRVMFNDYHVIPVQAHGKMFPAECPPLPAVMKPQEEMLEYALFDLSAFVQPVVVPTISIAFAPSPLTGKSGDTADQLVVNVTNTSATTPIDSFVTMTFALPPLVTVTAMTDSTGGWICTVATLSCTRTTELAAGASDAVTLTLSVGTYTTAPSAGQLTATVSDATFSTNPSASDTVIFQQQPVITWATPKAIIFGTPLSGTQLDATANVAGSFVYSPAAGAVLAVGQQTLQATFTPTDALDYSSATSTVKLTVLPATPLVTVSANANPIFLSNAVSFTASFPTLPVMPTGTIAFMDGGTQIGTATISSGSATFTTTALTDRTAFHHRGLLRRQQLHGGNEPRDGGKRAGLHADRDRIERGECARRRHGDLYVDDYARGWPNYARNDKPEREPSPAGGDGYVFSGYRDGELGRYERDHAGEDARLEPRSSLHAGCSAAVAFPWPWGWFCCPLPGDCASVAAAGACSILLAVSAAVLAAGVSGCGSPRPVSYPMTVTAASGSLSHSASFELTVQ